MYRVEKRHINSFVFVFQRGLLSLIRVLWEAQEKIKKDHRLLWGKRKTKRWSQGKTQHVSAVTRHDGTWQKLKQSKSFSPVALENDVFPGWWDYILSVTRASQYQKIDETSLLFWRMVYNGDLWLIFTSNERKRLRRLEQTLRFEVLRWLESKKPKYLVSLWTDYMMILFFSITHGNKKLKLVLFILQSYVCTQLTPLLL